MLRGQGTSPSFILRGAAALEEKEGGREGLTESARLLGFFSNFYLSSFFPGLLIWVPPTVSPSLPEAKASAQYNLSTTGVCAQEQPCCSTIKRTRPQILVP